MDELVVVGVVTMEEEGDGEGEGEGEGERDGECEEEPPKTPLTLMFFDLSATISPAASPSSSWIIFFLAVNLQESKNNTRKEKRVSLF